jgi:hypothetical protein
MGAQLMLDARCGAASMVSPLHTHAPHNANTHAHTHTRTHTHTVLCGWRAQAGGQGPARVPGGRRHRHVPAGLGAVPLWRRPVLARHQGAPRLPCCAVLCWGASMRQRCVRHPPVVQCMRLAVALVAPVASDSVLVPQTPPPLHTHTTTGPPTHTHHHHTHTHTHNTRPQAELPFLNSLKMKMSILLGVTHMNLGIVMSLFNNLYFRDRLSTLCEFVPQVRRGRGARCRGSCAQRGAACGAARCSAGPVLRPHHLRLAPAPTPPPPPKKNTTTHAHTHTHLARARHR